MKAVSTRKLREDFEQGVKILEKQGEQLAQHGWILPYWATPGEVRKILALDDAQAIDEVFSHFYNRNEFRFLKRIETEICTEESIEQWHPLLKECFAAYYSSYYLVPIPALLAILEGVLAKKTGKFDYNMNWPNYANKKLKRGEKLHGLFEVSVRYFMGKLMKTHKFGDSRPEKLNRNWILHGRDETTWTQADCLRLFQALHTITMSTVTA